MIKKIYIINESGLCVFHYNFEYIRINNKEESNEDTQLIAGFFTAIDSFVHCTAGKHETIRSILLVNRAYYFLPKNNFIFVLEADNFSLNLLPADYLNLLESISEQFMVYHESLGKNEIVMMIEDPTFIDYVKQIVAKIIRRSILKCEHRLEQMLKEEKII